MRSRWIPVTVMALAAIGLTVMVVSLAVGEHGPSTVEIDEVGEVQELLGGIRQLDNRLGDDDAPVTITVFTDVQCPRCASYQRQVVDPLIADYARTGEAKMILRHRPLGLKPVTLGAIGSVAAADQDRGWQYASLFMRNLDQVPERGVDEDFINSVAAATPKLETRAWGQIVGTEEVRERAQDDDELAAELRISADPALLIEGPRGGETLEGSPTLEQAIDAIERVR